MVSAWRRCLLSPRPSLSFGAIAPFSFPVAFCVCGRLFPTRMHVDKDVPISLAAYSCCSISMILLNKLVMDTHGLDYPMGLLFSQNAAALILVVVAKKQGWVDFPPFDWNIARKWLPLTLLFVAMLWTSMKSLKTMSVAVQTILKNLSTIITACGDWYFFEKKLSIYIFGAFGVMATGAYLGSRGDPWVTAEGLFWTLTNVTVTSCYLLYMKLLMGDVTKEIGKYGPVFYNNLLSLPFLFLPAAPTLPSLINGIANGTAGMWFCVAGMVCVGGVMTFATFWCMRVTSPTTYAVTGSLNKIPLALLGIFVFGHHPSAMGWFGIAVALSGGMWYTWLNLPRAPPPSPKDLEDPNGGNRRV